MIWVNSSTVIGNILLRVAEQGITEISTEEIQAYADKISHKLSASSCETFDDDCYTVIISHQDIITFAYAYEFLCKLVNDKLILKKENGISFCKMSRYFRSSAPAALIRTVNDIVCRSGEQI